MANQDEDLEQRFARIQKQNEEIMQRQKEIEKDKALAAKNNALVSLKPLIDISDMMPAEREAFIAMKLVEELREQPRSKDYKLVDRFKENLNRVSIIFKKLQLIDPSLSPVVHDFHTLPSHSSSSSLQPQPIVDTDLPRASSVGNEQQKGLQQPSARHARYLKAPRLPKST